MTDINCPRPPCMACPWRAECPQVQHAAFETEIIPWARLIARTQAAIDTYRRAGERIARGRAVKNTSKPNGL